MKHIKRYSLVCLLSLSMLLTACDEGGFGLPKNNNYDEKQTETIGDQNQNNNTSGSQSGSNGSGDIREDNTNQGNINHQPHGQTGEQPPAIDPIDIGSKIVLFKGNCLKTDETNYVNITFETDPFEDRYDFAYYTINDAKLDNSAFKEKEVIDNVETYKIYLGSNEAGTYVIKFYNNEQELYGRSDLSILSAAEGGYKPYLSVALKLTQMRFLAIYYSIQDTFKRIGNFFSNMANSDRISM